MLGYLYSSFRDNSGLLFERSKNINHICTQEEYKVSYMFSSNFTREQIAVALCDESRKLNLDVDKTILWIYVNTFMEFSLADFFFNRKGSNNN